MIDAKVPLNRSNEWEPPEDPIRYTGRVNEHHVSMLPKREATPLLSTKEVNRRLNHHRMAFGFR